MDTETIKTIKEIREIAKSISGKLPEEERIKIAMQIQRNKILKEELSAIYEILVRMLSFRGGYQRRKIRVKDLRSVDDTLQCLKCSSNSVFEYSTDEIQFGEYRDNNAGHYYVDCSCSNCGNNFRAYIKFRYSVTHVTFRNTQ